MTLASDRYVALPGSWCHEQGHDGMATSEHWEAHEESAKDIGDRAKEKSEAGWVTVAKGGTVK